MLSPAGWRWFPWALAATILLVPLVAMQFTSEVNWDAFDFAVAAVLLFGAAAGLELIARATREKMYRLILGAALVGVVALVWAHGTVGIF